MKVTQGVDYSWARPGGAAIKAAAKDFVARYLDYPGAGGKGLTADEVADYHANEISICFLFESTADRMLAGWNAGVEDANLSLAALNALSVPQDRQIVHFCCDLDAQSAQFPALIDYLQGVGSIFGGPERVGIYGSFAVVNAMRAAGVCWWVFQTYAWSGGQVSDSRNLYQYSNGEWNGQVDFTEAYGDDYGQWPIYTPVYQRAATLEEVASDIRIDPATGRPMDA